MASLHCHNHINISLCASQSHNYNADATETSMVSRQPEILISQAAAFQSVFSWKISGMSNFCAKLLHLVKFRGVVCRRGEPRQGAWEFLEVV